MRSAERSRRVPSGRAVALAAGLAVVLASTGCGSGPAQPRQPASPATSTTTPTDGASDGARPTPTLAPTRPPTGTGNTTAPSSLSAAAQARLDRRLIGAAWSNDVGLARRLIDRGADVNAKDDTTQSAYLIACSEGYLELLELTLRKGAKVDDKDSFDGTGLIRAAERGHFDVVGRLLRAGIDRDHVNNLGWTALHEAVHLGDGSGRYLDTVRVLVAAGVDVAVESPRDGSTPRAYALAHGFDDIARLLQRAQAEDRRSTRRADAERRLLAAARAGDPDAAALALRAGAGIEARDADRRTPLLLAAANDRVATARLLVALGADPDALDAIHDTPWLVTGVTGSVAMLETLLPAGPDLTIRNRFGGVSVIPASERGHVDYVRRVVRTGIDVNHVNDLGWTALLEAVILGDGSAPYQEIVRILLAAGADPSVPDDDGVAAVEHAERRGQTQVARLLRRAEDSGE